MYNDKKQVSRKAAPRRNAIVAELRRQIVTGLLQPGNRLPTRRELRAHFQSGVVTLQRALDRLKGEGFVSTRSTAGTYVASHPPHLSRYGLVFPSRPESWHRWMRFWTVLSEQTEEIERITPFRMPRYYMEGSFKGEDYELLLRDVGSDRLAGLILTFPSDFLKGTALLQPRRLPMVALAEAGQEGIPAVAHDHKAFVSEALDYLFIGIGTGRGEITFDANDFHFRKLQLRASFASPAIYYPAVLRLLKAGVIPGDRMISHVLGLADIAKAVAAGRDEKETVLKVVVAPGKG